MVRAHGVRNCREAARLQAGREVSLDATDQARALVDEGGIELNERRPGPDLRIGICAAGNAADADQRQAARGEPVDPAQQLGREGEQRSSAEAAALPSMAAMEIGWPAGR